MDGLDHDHEIVAVSTTETFTTSVDQIEMPALDTEQCSLSLIFLKHFCA